MKFGAKGRYVNHWQWPHYTYYVVSNRWCRHIKLNKTVISIVLQEIPLRMSTFRSTVCVQFYV